jgi:hypothetical protein
MQLKLADAEYRFAAVLTAGAEYVQARYDLAELSPVRAMELHLLPADLISQDFLSRDPESSPIQRQLLLARDDHGYIVAGVTAPYNVLRQLVKTFGEHAVKIEYLSMEPPYGLVERPSGEMQLLLIISFNRANLQIEAARIKMTAAGQR